MAITLIGTDRDSVVNFGNQRWWAERGMLHMEDKRTGEFRTVMVHDVLLRTKALNDMIGNSLAHPQGTTAYTDEMLRIQSFIESMLELCKKAKAQGRPDDPKVVAQMRRDAQGKTRLHVMPGALSQF